jgi:hypothetical protein
MSNEGQREMPKYQCHKKVWAMKIEKIESDIDVAKREDRETHGGAHLSLVDPTDGSKGDTIVSADYMTKHNPQVGGYYVVYEDVYASFSPAKAFEDGYTRVTP